MKEKKEKMSEQDSKGMNRGDFLKVVGAAGLGVAGLSAVASAPVSAEEGKKGKYIIVVTHGGNNPNRAILGLLLADVAQKKGLGDVYVWMTLEGADLCKKGNLEKISSPVYQKFGNALEIAERVRKNGGKFGLCPPCADYFGVKGDEKYDWVELQGGDWLMKNIQDAWVIWM